MSKIAAIVLVLLGTTACPSIAQQVVGTSVIWISGGTVQTYSSTDMDYWASAYYDSYTEGYLYQDSSLVS